MRTLIIDDEKGARVILKSQIERNCPEIEIIGEASNIDDAINLINTSKPDLIFLDIQLADGLSFEILNKINNPENYHIIFTTAYNQYAIKAFKYNAIDYLLKPIDNEELVEAVYKINLNKTKYNQAIFDNLIHQLENKQGVQQKITLSTSEGLFLISLDDILFLNSEGNYTKFYLQDGTTKLTSKTLKEYEKLLPENRFYRVHLSYVVNLNKIKSFNTSYDLYLELTNGSKVPVSTRKKSEVYQLLSKGL